MTTLKDIKKAQEPKLLFNARRRKDTEEFHLFKGTMKAENKCDGRFELLRTDEVGRWRQDVISM